MCDDANPCTTDTCAASGQCEHDGGAHEDQPCDAGGGEGSGVCKAGDCGSTDYAYVPPGDLMMGSPEGETFRLEDEIPQHKVQITRGFWMKVNEVTQVEWTALMGTAPSYFPDCGDDCPVDRVSWWDAVAYCNELSRKEGLEECYELSGCTGEAGGGCEDPVPTCIGDYSCATVVFAGPACSGYRLPTEAEWEHAYRAGTTTPFYNGQISTASCADEGLDLIAWFCGSEGNGTHPVRRKEPNAWGLYDMSGNVSEWVWDWYDAGFYAGRPDPDADPLGPALAADLEVRVHRGGSHGDTAPSCRAADRGSEPPDSRALFLGLRPVRTVLE